MATHRGLHYLRKNFDSAAIVTALSTIALADEAGDLTKGDHAILAALRRSNSVLENAPLPEIQDYLRGLDDGQVPGLVSNVKGILLEMEFVRVENEDGDSVYASYFDATTHPDTDIQLLDRSTGETWEAQLKATDDAAYVTDWIERHPGGEILVTDELAQRMDLQTSRQSNNELTTDVEDFVDKMLSANDADDFLGLLPGAQCRFGWGCGVGALAAPSAGRDHLGCVQASRCTRNRAKTREDWSYRAAPFCSRSGAGYWCSASGKAPAQCKGNLV